MQKLAKREEQIMQILWQLNKAFVREIIEEFPEPKPYNTIATLIKILKDKGFVNSRKLGNTYQYSPAISKDEYQNKAVGDVLKSYFDNSYSKMVAYFAKEEKISEGELEDILKMIKKK
jgi:predicted transcriptional regulator